MWIKINDQAILQIVASEIVKTNKHNQHYKRDW